MNPLSIFIFKDRASNSRTLDILESVNHIRDSFLMDIYPNQVYDMFLGLDENNSEIHAIWKNIFNNSTLDENITWLKNKELNTIFINKGLQFTNDINFLKSVADTIFTEYKCL